jgi:predicted membrane protein
MDYGWYDLVGNVGVALMVLAYLLLQAEKLRSSDLSYSLMNGVGALLVLISLLYRFNLSAFLVEAFWLLISIYGLIKFVARPRAKESR